MKKLLFYIASGILGLWAATLLVPEVQVQLLPDSHFFGVSLTAAWQIFLVLGVTLGLLQFFIKPILDLISLPLRIITLGLFGIIIQAIFIFALDMIFREFTAPLLWPLLWAAVIMSAAHSITAMLLLKNED